MLVIFDIFLMILVAVYWAYIFVMKKRENEYIKLLGQQERFMGNLLNEYSSDGNLSEALVSAMKREDTLYNKQNNLMIDSLSDEVDSESSTWFIRNSKNSYISLLYALCATVRTYGDSLCEGVSLFAKNLRYIKDELRGELLLCEEKKYQFSGLFALSAVPFFFNMLIEKWAVGIADDMKEYFYGMYGVLTLILCFAVTIASMWMISLMEYEIGKKSGVDYFIRKFLEVDFINDILDRYIAANYARFLRLNDELKKMSVYSDIKYFLSDRIVSGLICMTGISVFYLFMGTIDIAILPLLLVIAFFTGYMMPRIKIIIYHYRNRNQMMEETLRLQTLVLLLMHYSEITVEEILSWMEKFADLFRDSIERAVDDLSYQRKNALERLAFELKYEPAVRIAQGMAACDEIPIERAFYDLESEREYYMQQYKQSSFDSLKERAAISKLIAFAPFVTVLATRLIIPFVLVGLKELSDYSAVLV